MVNTLSSRPSEAPVPNRGKSVIGHEIGNFLTDITNLLGALADPIDLAKKPGSKDIW